MTTIRFGLTATAPGETVGQAWNAYWVGMSAWQTYDVPMDAPDTTIGINPISLGSTLLWASAPLLGLVTAYCGGPADDSVEYFKLNAQWNTIKDIELTQLDADTLTVSGFVDTWIAAPEDDASHSISVASAKRGAIDLGNGNNIIDVNYLSNEYTWSNHFHIGLGNGNNTIYVQPDYYYAYSATPLPWGWSFNTAPDQTAAGITLGNGNNNLSLSECSATISVGNGSNKISLVDGHNALVLGNGVSVVTIAAYDTAQPAPFALANDRGSDIVQLGSGHADITIDDTMAFMTPLTTIIVTHGQTATGTAEGADDIRYGHMSGNTFVGGDWSAVTLDLAGYSAGSSTTLTQAGDHSVLTIQDGAGGPADVINLYGVSPSSVAALHPRFS